MLPRIVLLLQALQYFQNKIIPVSFTCSMSQNPHHRKRPWPVSKSRRRRGMRGGRSNCKEGRDRSQESVVEKILPSLGRGTNTEFDIPLEALTNEVSKTAELDKESSCDKR